MTSKLSELLIEEKQSRVPVADKMDEGVVVVVESGQLESKKVTNNPHDCIKEEHVFEERDGDQTGEPSEEKDELIQIALAAEENAEREATADFENGAESTGLSKMEMDDGVVDRKVIERSMSNLEAAEVKGHFQARGGKSGNSRLSYDSSCHDPVTNFPEGKLMLSSTLSESDPTINQATDVDVGGSGDMEGKDLEVVVMSEIENAVKNELFEEGGAEHMDSDVKMDGERSRNFTCEECGKKFTHISSIKRHMLKHREGEPPVVYQCLACSKTFQYNSSLKRHLKLHSEETSGKAYTCKECSKAFMYATSLKRHLKTHSGKEIYPCPHCQRCFEYVSSLKRHSKLHTEGKGFKCSICSKSFGYLSSLTRHQRVHQKSLTCAKCNKEFRLYKSYVKHLEQHGEVIGEAELAVMQVEESDPDEDEVDEEVDAKEQNGDPTKEDENADENAVSASMVATSMDESNEKEQLDAIQGDVIDLQSPENHPFVKFVVSQNTVTLEQLQSFQAAQAASSAEGTQNQDSVAYAMVHADGNTVIGENSIVSSEINELTGTPVGGIVLVEFDENNKVTERHMEGLQASNLLQLLQAVEGFAVENNAQVEQQTSQQKVEEPDDENSREGEDKQSEKSDEIEKNL